MWADDVAFLWVFAMRLLVAMLGVAICAVVSLFYRRRRNVGV
jgi:heme A synthase